MFANTLANMCTNVLCAGALCRVRQSPPSSPTRFVHVFEYMFVYMFAKKFVNMFVIKCITNWIVNISINVNRNVNINVDADGNVHVNANVFKKDFYQQTVVYNKNQQRISIQKTRV